MGFYFKNVVSGKIGLVINPCHYPLTGSSCGLRKHQPKMELRHVCRSMDGAARPIFPQDAPQSRKHQTVEHRSMQVRGIRGAINVEADTPAEVLSATRQLLEEILASNDLDDYEEIVSAVFTTTPDLTSAFPAEAARSLGMNHVPLLCASEIAVASAMPRCIRVLLHVNTTRRQDEIVHVYLRDAKQLRPDMQSAQ